MYIDKILNIFSANRQTALLEYEKFMDETELIIKAKDFFEEGDVIGEDILENDSGESQGNDDYVLDEILRLVVENDEDFQLIKSGSRKRYLRDNKIKYVKRAVEAGYTFKEIGRNIGISAEAANKMVQ